MLLKNGYKRLVKFIDLLIQLVWKQQQLWCLEQLETDEEIVEHWELLRKLQDETAGFRALLCGLFRLKKYKTTWRTSWNQTSIIKIDI